MPDTLNDVVARFRAEVETRNATAMRRLAESYARIYARLSAEAQEFIAYLAERQKAGEALTRGQAQRLERYRRLLGDVTEQMQRYAAVIEDEVLRGQADMAVMGQEHALSLLRWEYGALPDPARGSIVGTFQRMPVEAVEAMLGALQEDSPLWRRTLSGFGDAAALGIGDALVRNLAAGRSPRATAREIRDAFGVPLTRALTITRTEQVRAHRLATLNSYRANGHLVKGWRWNSALQARSCMGCIALHGRLFPLTETLDDHPRGLCFATPELVSFRDLGIDMDDPGPFMAEGDGERWFRALTEAQQREMMGPAKYAAWRDGKFAFDRLVHEGHDDEWGRTFSEASLAEILGSGAGDYYGRAA